MYLCGRTARDALLVVAVLPAQRSSTSRYSRRSGSSSRAHHCVRHRERHRADADIDGRIEIESGRGGTVVRIVLPVHRSEETSLDQNVRD
jgi:hypothetical protein